MLGGAVFPSILHQDPRYFYKGTGSIRSRALYALSTVVIAGETMGAGSRIIPMCWGRLPLEEFQTPIIPRTIAVSH